MLCAEQLIPKDPDSNFVAATEPDTQPDFQAESPDLLANDPDSQAFFNHQAPSPESQVDYVAQVISFKIISLLTVYESVFF